MSIWPMSQREQTFEPVSAETLISSLGRTPLYLVLRASVWGPLNQHQQRYNYHLLGVRLSISLSQEQNL